MSHAPMYEVTHRVFNRWQGNQLVEKEILIDNALKFMTSIRIFWTKMFQIWGWNDFYLEVVIHKLKLDLKMKVIRNQSVFGLIKIVENIIEDVFEWMGIWRRSISGSREEMTLLTIFYKKPKPIFSFFLLKNCIFLKVYHYFKN